MFLLISIGVVGSRNIKNSEAIIVWTVDVPVAIFTIGPGSLPSVLAAY